jgi:hypothetical protein
VFRIRIRIQLVAWIRIHIPNADPDPGGLKRGNMRKKNSAKRQIIRHKKYKNQFLFAMDPFKKNRESFLLSTGIPQKHCTQNGIALAIYNNAYMSVILPS